MVTGYLHADYARSLSEFGTPRKLTRSGGWILERQIPSSPYRDGMGCYPLFCCQDWSKLHVDLNDFRDVLITLSLVTDPFGDFDLEYLNKFFDLVIPFKRHYIADLSMPTNKFVHKKWRQNARKAKKQGVYIEKCEEPKKLISEWDSLYKCLIDRHNIKGIRAFSRRSFAKQLNIPGLVMFRALFQNKAIGAMLWYVQEEVAYAHLLALSPLGYELKASYGLYDISFDYFSEDNKVHWLNLGAGAGIKDNGKDGLSRFKKGWSNGTRTAYFCGRIFNKKKYLEIVKSKGSGNTDYFPAYRMGEFV